MKNNVIAWAILLLMYAFPFRYAFLEDHKTDIVWILNFLLVIFGMLAFFLMTISDPKEDKSA